ncbi:hypothetical protein M8J77_011937 [Diaphorina citri]|nr:hypothetical protein M8J77_011937 [Diaphorina citri]
MRFHRTSQLTWTVPQTQEILVPTAQELDGNIFTIASLERDVTQPTIREIPVPTTQELAGVEQFVGSRNTTTVYHHNGFLYNKKGWKNWWDLAPQVQYTTTMASSTIRRGGTSIVPKSPDVKSRSSRLLRLWRISSQFSCKS